MRYHNSLCTDTLAGLFEKCPLVSVSLRKHYLLRNKFLVLGLSPQLPEEHDFWTICHWNRGTLLYFVKLDFHGTTSLLPFSWWIHILQLLAYCVSIKNKNQKKPLPHRMLCNGGLKVISTFDMLVKFGVP